MYEHEISYVINFLKGVGFVFEVDYDDSVTVRVPDGLSARQIADVLQVKHQETLAKVMKFRRSVELAHCVGGPLNGKKHGWGMGHHIVFKVGRADWAAYVVVNDGRGMYCGSDKSEKKAKALAAKYAEDQKRTRTN